MNVEELTVGGIIEGLKEKEFSVVELVEDYLRRIKAVDKKVRAFLTVTEKEAIKGAEAADRAIGELGAEAFERQPLLGVPVGYKDLYLTKGLKTTAGSKVLEGYVPQYSATVVERMEKAGAIILGKLNCDAWGHGASGENSDYFSTRNPWDLERVPGGSSSGSGAAVAARMVPVAFGTDTGGSIRCPAAYCGVTGIKPTYGRVSRYGVVAMASSLDAMGHFTGRVEDAARVLGMTAGWDLKDATSSEIPVANYIGVLGRPVKGIKVGLPKEYFDKGLNGEVKEAVMTAAKKFEELGMKIVEVSLPYSRYIVSAYYIIQPAEVSSNLARYDGVRFGDDRKSFGDEAKRRIIMGTYVLSAGYYDAYYKRAVKVRGRIKSDFEEAFGEVDVILGPVSPTLPFKLGEKCNDPMQMYLEDVYTAGVNLAGLPALALPCGFSKNNLPIGMQIIGPYFEEGRLFKVGDAYQRVTDWHDRKPELAEVPPALKLRRVSKT